MVVKTESKPELAQRLTPLLGETYCRQIIEKYLDHFYFGPKMTSFPDGYQRILRAFKGFTVEGSLEAVSQVVPTEGKEQQLKILTEKIDGSIVGTWSEILICRAINSCPGLASLKVSHTKYSRDVQKPGVDLKFSDKDVGHVNLKFSLLEQKRDLFFVDLYSGNQAEVLLEKINFLIEQGPKSWFVLPLCLKPKEGLPKNINRPLELFPGFDQKELREKIARLILMIIKEGRTPGDLTHLDALVNQELIESIGSRLLAGYLIMRRQPGSNLKEVPVLEEMIRRRYAS